MLQIDFLISHPPVSADARVSKHQLCFNAPAKIDGIFYGRELKKD
jgi:hypothetical protein